MGKVFVSQGQATPKRIVPSGPKLNPSKVLGLSLLSPTLMKFRLKLKALWHSQHFLHYRSMEKMFCLSRAITPKPKVQSGLKSNLFKILCLLPASVMKIQSNMKAQSCSQHFLHYKSMGKFSSLKGK